jgi:hypothetical protein
MPAAERERLYEQAARDADLLEAQGRQLRRLTDLLQMCAPWFVLRVALEVNVLQFMDHNKENEVKKFNKLVPIVSSAS